MHLFAVIYVTFYTFFYQFSKSMYSYNPFMLKKMQSIN
jgi:hypothetical protein